MNIKCIINRWRLSSEIGELKLKFILQAVDFKFLYLHQWSLRLKVSLNHKLTAQQNIKPLNA
jgi:hypothetical protein